jgi:hypothetical protein
VIHDWHPLRETGGGVFFIVDVCCVLRYPSVAMNVLYRVINTVKGRIAPAILNRTVPSTTVKADQLLFGGAVLSNAGATGPTVFALPVAQPGMRLTAAVAANLNLVLDLPTGDTIRGLATSGQTYSADAVGETLQLVCVVPTIWESLGAVDGVWTAV